MCCWHGLFYFAGDILDVRRSKDDPGAVARPERRGEGRNDTAESLNAYLSKAGFEFPVVLDAGKGFAKQNLVRGTPSVLIIDAAGKIQESYRGLSDDKKDQLAKGLAQLSKN